MVETVIRLMKFIILVYL